MRFLDQLHRILVLPELLCHEAEVAQRIRVLRIALKDLPVDLLRLRQSAGLMVFHRELQPLSGRHRGNRVTTVARNSWNAAIGAVSS